MQSKPYLLYIGGSSSYLVPQIEKLSQLLIADQARTIEEVREATENQFYPLIVYEASPSEDPHLRSYVQELRKDFPLTLFLVSLQKHDHEAVKQIVHELRPWRVILDNISVTDLKSCLSAAFGHYQQALSRRSVLERVKLQNKRLEEMTHNLEGLIRDRTEDLSRSKIEIEKNISMMSRLIRFVQDINGLMSPEELLLILRNEARIFHKVTEIILAISRRGENGLSTTRLIYDRGQGIHSRKVKAFGEDSERLVIDSKENSIFLANEFGRPFSKVMAVSLGLVGEKNSAKLFFEHAFDSKEGEDFIEFMGQRVQTLSLALERSLLEEEYREESLLWEHTFDGIEDPIAIVTRDWEVLRANRHFFSELGKGQSCFKLFAYRDQPCLNCPLSLEAPRRESTQSVIQRGESLFEAYSDPISSGASGEPFAFVHHYVDVSHEQRLQSQMIQNEKMVAIGHLAGHIAHELNNPLTGIRSLAQLLVQETEGQARLRADLEEVERAAARSQKIINNLLTFARKKGVNSRELFDVNEVIRDTLTFLKTAMTPYLCHLDLSESPLCIQGDSQLLQQVVFNLVNNACQAMEGKGEIHIRSHKMQRGEKGYSVEIEIEDQGPGIPAEFLPNIFEPFFTTKGKGQGTGLGLSLSRDIIRAMEGEIEVESELGGGTKFCIRLPLREAHENTHCG